MTREEFEKFGESRMRFLNMIVIYQGREGFEKALSSIVKECGERGLGVRVVHYPDTAPYNWPGGIEVTVKNVDELGGWGFIATKEVLEGKRAI